MQTIKLSQLPVILPAIGMKILVTTADNSSASVLLEKVGGVKEGDTITIGFGIGDKGGYINSGGVGFDPDTEGGVELTKQNGLRIGTGVTINGTLIKNVASPKTDDGAANKAYVDSHSTLMATAAATFAEGRTTTMVLPNKFNIVDGLVEGEMDFYFVTREELAEQEAEEQEQLVIEGAAEQTEQTEATEEQTSEQAEPYTPEPMVEMYHLRFTTVEGDISLTFPERIKLPDGQAFLPNRIYDVQVVNECAIVNSWSV